MTTAVPFCLYVLTAKIKSTYQWFPFVLDGWLNKNSLTTAEMIPEHKDPGIVWNVDINYNVLYYSVLYFCPYRNGNEAEMGIWESRLSVNAWLSGWSRLSGLQILTFGFFTSTTNEFQSQNVKPFLLRQKIFGGNVGYKTEHLRRKKKKKKKKRIAH